MLAQQEAQPKVPINKAQGLEGHSWMTPRWQSLPSSAGDSRTGSNNNDLSYNERVNPDETTSSPTTAQQESMLLVLPVAFRLKDGHLMDQLREDALAIVHPSMLPSWEGGCMQLKSRQAKTGGNVLVLKHLHGHAAISTGQP
jgi:hypothetical protein